VNLLSLAVGIGLAAFAVGCVLKAIRYLRMPAHVRWELYPIPEGRLGQLRTIVEEILTLRMVREKNPRLWLPSLLFHYGLYLLFALGVTLLASGPLAGVGAHATGIQGSAALSIWGALGIACGSVGALGLLLRRGLDPGIRASSTPGDFLNLAWLLTLFGVSAGAWLFADREYGFARAFFAAMFEGRGLAPAPSWFIAEALLLAGFLAYLPATHMTHFFGKWFTWHAVRWNEEPVVAGGALEKELQRLLGRPVHWSAAHIGADGKKSWGEIASEERP
jgi:nitrate reductase gamma subunit